MLSPEKNGKEPKTLKNWERGWPRERRTPLSKHEGEYINPYWA